MSGDLTRLPKWAQQHITNLARRAEAAESALRDYRSEQPESNAWIETGLTRSDRQYLPDQFGHLRVVFRLAPPDEGSRQEPLITVGVRDGALEVMAVGYPHSLSIKPQASNVVHVGVTR